MDAVAQSTQSALARQAEAPEAEAEDEAEAEAPEQDEKQLNTLLKRCESAFTKGNKSLLLSRVECGKWCHAIYVLRMEGGHKDRSFTSMQIFSRLAVHADNRRECDGTMLAKLFKTVELLATGDNWKALTLGKLEDLSVLVSRTEGTELYSVFDIARTEDAKGIFSWACGDGLKRPSREDIKSRVTEITDPEKFAEKQAEKAAKQGAGGAETSDDDEAEETEVSENRLLGSNAYSHCQPVAVEIREAIRTTSMIDDCNARALTPLRKSSIAVLSSRQLSPFFLLFVI